mmetsp:Transcript_20855/g.51255  ORF Transcript_20855/g.51255 Transcript_20855/m.51255 type:complete len:290 (+) Transcript_20855:64-933(+)
MSRRQANAAGLLPAGVLLLSLLIMVDHAVAFAQPFAGFAGACSGCDGRGCARCGGSVQRTRLEAESLRGNLARMQEEMLSTLATPQVCAVPHVAGEREEVLLKTCSKFETPDENWYVYSGVVEDALQSMRGVEQVAVIGLKKPKDEYDIRTSTDYMAAVFQMEKGARHPTLDEINAFLAKQIPENGQLFLAPWDLRRITCYSNIPEEMAPQFYRPPKKWLHNKKDLPLDIYSQKKMYLEELMAGDFKDLIRFARFEESLPTFEYPGLGLHVDKERLKRQYLAELAEQQG